MSLKKIKEMKLLQKTKGLDVNEKSRETWKRKRHNVFTTGGEKWKHSECKAKGTWKIK